MVNKFFFSLASIEPKISNAAGSLTYVTLKETPGLVNISFANLKLNAHGVLEPIWHPNANKIGYCTQGRVLISIRSFSGEETFTVEKGEIFFIPQGVIHHIENIGEAESVVNFALSDANPETMHLSKAVYSISENVFNATFNPPAGFLDGLSKNKGNESIRILVQDKQGIKAIASRYKFDIEESSKAILTKGGYVQLGLKDNLSVLEGLGILGFGLNLKGIVEPHWHTNAGELVFIVKGMARITILSPDGNVDVLEVKAGEGAFAPASHFHNIENIGTENIEVIAFFSHAEPNYVGIGEVIGSYSNEVLASVFNVQSNYFDNFKKPQGPLVIVPI